MTEAVEGIIIFEKDYGETSKILDIITDKYGLISVISKGCKTIKSPLRSVSSKLIHGTFHIYYKKDKLSLLKTVDVIDTYINLRSDLDKITYASMLLELSSQVIKQNSNPSIYDILKSALKKIDEGFDALVITDIVSLKYLEFLGVLPILDRCSKCGSPKGIVSLSTITGGYVCSKCLTNETKTSEKAIKLIRMLYYVDISKITNLNISDDVKLEIHSFLENYYEVYTGLYFKTKKMLGGMYERV